MRLVTSLSRPLLGGLLSAFCFASSVLADAYWEPKVGVRIASHLEGSDPFTQQQLFAGVKVEGAFDDVEFKLDAEFSHDFVYRSQNNFSVAAENELEQDLLVDDAYIGFEAWDSYWTVGYQTVVWGEADDLRVVDVVNPLYLRDFVLFDVDDYRLSVPMVKMERDIGDDSSLSVLGIWQYRSNHFPPLGAEFGENFYAGVNETKTGNPEFGIRFNTFRFDTDFSFYGFYGYEDNPVLVPDATGQLQPQLSRFSMAGLSSSTPVDNWVIRTEWLFGRNNATQDVTLTPVRLNKVQGLLGLDYRYRDWTATFQITDRRFNGWHDGLLLPESDPTATLSLDREFLSGRLALRLAGTHMSANGGGSLAQGKITYQYSSKLIFNLNLDLLNGSPSNFLGQFKNSDRIWFSVTHFI